MKKKNTRAEDNSYIYKIKLIKCLALIWRRRGIIIHSVTAGMRLQNTTREGGIKQQMDDTDNEISLMPCVGRLFGKLWEGKGSLEASKMRKAGSEQQQQE